MNAVEIICVTSTGLTITNKYVFRLRQEFEELKALGVGISKKVEQTEEAIVEMADECNSLSQHVPELEQQEDVFKDKVLYSIYPTIKKGHNLLHSVIRKLEKNNNLFMYLLMLPHNHRNVQPIHCTVLSMIGVWVCTPPPSPGYFIGSFDYSNLYQFTQKYCVT